MKRRLSRNTSDMPDWDDDDDNEDLALPELEGDEPDRERPDDEDD